MNNLYPPTPVGPADNEIWYWGEYYDLANAISLLEQQGFGFSYVGPAILSNEQVGDKYVITFDGPVTKLGLEMTEEESLELYPIFMNYMGVECNITGIEIPNSVTSVWGNAFFNCTGLTSFAIPNSTTRIGGEAFSNCTSLTSVTIGNSVTSIGSGAFGGCTGLASMTIPDSVTSIGESAFSRCTGLTSVTLETETPPTLGGISVFYDTNNCPIYVPVSSVDAYKSAEGWSEYDSRIQTIQ